MATPKLFIYIDGRSERRQINKKEGVAFLGDIKSEKQELAILRKKEKEEEGQAETLSKHMRACVLNATARVSLTGLSDGSPAASEPCGGARLMARCQRSALKRGWNLEGHGPGMGLCPTLFRFGIATWNVKGLAEDLFLQITSVMSRRQTLILCI